MSSPSNFRFLAEHSPLLADLGATAERLFPFDPASCIVKLRLLAEAITQDIAARIGVNLAQPTQAELLRAVDMRLNMDAQVRQLFHLLRRTGNLAAHEVTHGIGYREGLEALKVAREIAVWFHRGFGRDRAFKPGPFVMPDDPSRKLAALQQQMQQLHAQLQDAQTAQSAQAEVARLLQAQAGNMPKINQRTVMSLHVRLPSLEEQSEIVRRVETLFAYADRLESRLASAQCAVDRLTPALLAKAFRGELVPQDPDDEPASMLLQRLRDAATDNGVATRNRKKTARKAAQHQADRSSTPTQDSPR